MYPNLRLPFALALSVAAMPLVGMEYLDFAAKSLRNVGTVGTVFKCSDAVANDLCSRLQCHQGPKRVLELGAGVGNISRIIVSHLTADDEFVAIEFLSAMIAPLEAAIEQALQEHFGDSPRPIVRVVPGDALAFTDKPFDYVISTLPLNSAVAFDRENLAKILVHMRHLVKEDGEITQVAYKGFPHIRTAAEALLIAARLKQQQDSLAHRLAMIHAYMDCYTTEKHVVYCNIPPINIWHITGFYAQNAEKFPAMPEFATATAALANNK